MKQIVIGSLLAAVVLFFFGFIFWGVLPNPDLHDPTDEAALWQSLADNAPEPGAYYLPNPEGGPASVERHEAGPIAFMFVRTAGEPVMPASMMIIGFLHMFGTALLIGLLLRMLAPQLTTYGSRVAFVALLGAVATFWADFAWPVWWRTPWGFFMWMALYDIIAWTLAGTVMARFVKPKTEAATA